MNVSYKTSDYSRESAIKHIMAFLEKHLDDFILSGEDVCSYWLKSVSIELSLDGEQKKLTDPLS